MKRKQKEIFENWSENFRLEEDLNRKQNINTSKQGIFSQHFFKTS